MGSYTNQLALEVANILGMPARRRRAALSRMPVSAFEALESRVLLSSAVIVKYDTASITIKDPSLLDQQQVWLPLGIHDTGTALPINTQAGQSFDGEIGFFAQGAFLFPHPNMSLTIDWGDGQSSNGTLMQGPDGSGEVFGQHTYTSAGAFSVSASMFIPGDHWDGVTGDLQTEAFVSSPNAHPVSLQSAAGQTFDGIVGTISGLLPNEFNTTIDWGDGQTSDGSVVPDGDHYDVIGTHAYQAGGVYNVSSTVTNAFDGTTIAQIQSSAFVTSTLGDQSYITATQNQTFDGVLGSFDTPFPIADYATAIYINWYDGQMSHGTLAPTGNGHYEVHGDHTFRAAGIFTFWVEVDVVKPNSPYLGEDPIVFSREIPVTVQVMAAPLAAVAGVPFNGFLGNFVQPDFFSLPFKTTVDWGDGTTSSATVVQTPDGEYSVSGQHTYAQGGDYAVKVTVVADANSAPGPVFPPPPVPSVVGIIVNTMHVSEPVIAAALLPPAANFNVNFAPNSTTPIIIQDTSGSNILGLNPASSTNNSTDSSLLDPLHHSLIQANLRLAE